VDLILFLLVTFIAVLAVVEIVKWEGRDFLLRGVIVGTLAPALAVILEAAFELGRPTMFWLEELAGIIARTFQHISRFLLAAIKRTSGAASLMLMILVGAGGALAAEQPIAHLYPERGSKLADFAVERQGLSGQPEIRTPDASGALFVGDVVRAIREGAAAAVRSIATRAPIARVTYNYPIKIVGEGTPPPRQPSMWTVPGASQATNTPGDPRETTVTLARNVRASKMIGSTVYDVQNRDIGSVKDLIIGKGRVAAAVVDVGTFLGVGGKYVAVPLDAIKTVNNRLTLYMSKDQLQQAQAYNLEDGNIGTGSSTGHHGRERGCDSCR
jgi:sporulation protein YlmC with PRC-barrel domain